MLTDSKLKSLIAFLLISGVTFGQYNANSIYSRYGLGDIVQTGFDQNKALGGLSVCTRQANNINFLNPASYNSPDSMSFLWDIGMLYNYNEATDNDGSLKKSSMNFDHLALAFPVTRNNFISAGLVPFSIMGYRTQTQEQSSPGIVNNSYSGSGKINRFYLGQAFGLFKNHLNFGFNISYIFGSLHRSESIEYYDINRNYDSPSYFYVNTNNEEKNTANGFSLNFGIQGTEKLSKGIAWIGGLTIEPKSKLKFKYTNSVYRLLKEKTGLNSALHNIDTSVNFMMPVRIGIGTGLIIRERLLIGVDYVIQDWSNSKFLFQDETFKMSNKLSVGIQYAPKCPTGGNYFEKITYRLGGFYNNTYLIYNNIPIKDYVISFGAGLPFTNSGTMFNFAVEIGSHGEKSGKLVEINYTRISLGLTFCDFRFNKRN